MISKKFMLMAIKTANQERYLTALRTATPEQKKAIFLKNSGFASAIAKARENGTPISVEFSK